MYRPNGSHMSKSTRRILLRFWAWLDSFFHFFLTGSDSPAFKHLFVEKKREKGIDQFVSMSDLKQYLFRDKGLVEVGQSTRQLKNSEVMERLLMICVCVLRSTSLLRVSWRVNLPKTSNGTAGRSLGTWASSTKAPRATWTLSFNLCSWRPLSDMWDSNFLRHIFRAHVMVNVLSIEQTIYKVPTEFDIKKKSPAQGMQRIFYEMQFSPKAVDSVKLTDSFNWTREDAMIQQDIQEFLRMVNELIEWLESCVVGRFCVCSSTRHVFVQLIDRLAERMIGTRLEGIIDELFGGETIVRLTWKIPCSLVRVVFFPIKSNRVFLPRTTHAVRKLDGRTRRSNRSRILV